MHITPPSKTTCSKTRVSSRGEGGGSSPFLVAKRFCALKIGRTYGSKKASCLNNSGGQNLGLLLSKPSHGLIRSWDQFNQAWELWWDTQQPAGWGVLWPWLGGSYATIRPCPAFSNRGLSDRQRNRRARIRPRGRRSRTFSPTNDDQNALSQITSHTYNSSTGTRLRHLIPIAGPKPPVTTR